MGCHALLQGIFPTQGSKPGFLHCRCIVYRLSHQRKPAYVLLLRRFSRVRLCDPIDGSPPASPVPGILQARTLQWVAISFSKALKRKVKVKSLSGTRLLATPWTAAYQAPSSMGFPSKSTGVGCHCLLRAYVLGTRKEVLILAGS